LVGTFRLTQSGVEQPLILSIHGKIVTASLAFWLAWGTAAQAAEHRLAGRWSNSSVSVGVIQFGQTVFVFGKGGWSMGRLEPGAAGMLAVGEGSWTFDARPGPATITVGEKDDHLYIIVLPIGASDNSEIKMILEPNVPYRLAKKA
jgi:hypothetical protein